jgi:hypothetical protein
VQVPSNADLSLHARSLAEWLRNDQQSQAIIARWKDDPATCADALALRLTELPVPEHIVTHIAGGNIEKLVNILKANTVYIQSVPSAPVLKEHYIDFAEIVRGNTASFVGRSFVFESISRFRQLAPCGYIRIVADAGLGKTALAAEITRTVEAAAFFVNAARNLTRYDRCLNHLSVALITQHSLPYDHLPVDAGRDSAFFHSVLREAAEKTKGPVWVVIDALDEADTAPPERNALMLPDHLPHGVYIVVTHRPGPYSLATGAQMPPPLEIKIDWNHPDQQADIDEYLRRQFQREELQRAVAKASDLLNIQEIATQQLRIASQGNFRYLEYLLNDIATDALDLSTKALAALPHGLREYYERFWARLSSHLDKDGWTDWNGLFRPLLGRLSVAREPVTVDWLASHIGREPDEILERALRPWQRFLSTERTGGLDQWRFVHTSFADFISTKLDSRKVHAAIASYYTADPQRWPQHDGYALRHLVHHMHRSGSIDDLLKWLERRDWFEAVGAYDPGGTIYLQELEDAWRAVEAAAPSGTLPGSQASSLEREAWLALALASLRHLATELPSSLLAALARSGVWDLRRLLATVRQTPGPAARSQLLATLIPETSQADRPALTAEALALAFSVSDPGRRAEALEFVTRHGSETFLERAIAGARTGDPLRRALALAALCEPTESVLSSSELRVEARQAAQELHGVERVRALARVVPLFADDERAALVADMLATCTSLRSEGSRLSDAVGDLSSVLRYATDKQRQEIVSSLLQRMADNSSSGELHKVAQSVGIYGTDEQKNELLVWTSKQRDFEKASLLRAVGLFLAGDLHAEAIRIARGIGDEEKFKNSALAVLALASAASPEESDDLHEAVLSTADGLTLLAQQIVTLEKEQRSDIQRIILVAAQKIGGHAAAAALQKLARTLPPDLHDVAFAIALEIKGEELDMEARAHALTALASTATNNREAKLRTALDAARKLPVEGLLDQRPRGDVVGELAPALPNGMLLDAVRSCSEIRDGFWRVRAVATLMQRLPEAGHATWLPYAMASARSIEEGDRWYWASPRLPPRRFPVPEELRDFRDNLSMSVAVRGAWQRSEALAALVPFLPGPERTSVIKEACTIASGISDDGDRSSAVASLIPLVVEYGDVSEALQMAQAIEAPDDVGLFRSELAARLLADGRLDDALALSGPADSEFDRTLVMANLVRFLDKRDRQNAIEQVIGTFRQGVKPTGTSRGSRVELLLPILPHLNKKHLECVLGIARAGMLDKADHAELLARLISVAPSGLHNELAYEARTILSDVESHNAKAWVLQVLLHLYHGPWRSEIAQDLWTCAAQITGVDRVVWTALAVPHLSLSARSSAMDDALTHLRMMFSTTLLDWRLDAALEAVIRSVACLPPEPALKTWRSLAEAAARNSRSLLLTLIGVSAGHFAPLSSRTSVMELIDACLKVGDQWP